MALVADVLSEVKEPNRTLLLRHEGEEVSLSVLAREHGVPFYVAAPCSTVDLDTPDGAAIPIEERGPAEVTHMAGQAIVPEGVPVRHPAFDVTPANLVTGLITDRGMIESPGEADLGRIFS